MGCVSSSNADPHVVDSVQQGIPVVSDHQKELTEAQQQRRRLSVTGALVGDIKGKRINPSESPISPRRVSLGPATLPDEIGLDLKHHEEDQLNQIANEHVAVTKKGFVPYNTQKVNQDTYIIHPKLFGRSDISLFGVCDGHGEFGHLVSAFVREKLPKALEEIKVADFLKDPPSMITKAVEKLCLWLKKSRINVTVSGTTATFAIKVNQTIYCANIGDSRCVLATMKDENSVVALQLTVDHKPDLPEEKKRIINSGGRVATLPGPAGADLGPMRVWLKEFDLPGLAMSRSIGDQISASVGVISTPEITVHEIAENDLFLIWASDGIWEFMDNQQVVDTLREYLPDFEVAAQKLVLDAEAQWKAHESVIDDITCVVLFLRDL